MQKLKSLLAPGLSAFLKVLVGINMISFQAFAGKDQKASIMHDSLNEHLIFIFHHFMTNLNSCQWLWHYMAGEQTDGA